MFRSGKKPKIHKTCSLRFLEKKDFENRAKLDLLRKLLPNCHFDIVFWQFFIESRVKIR